VGGSLGLSLRLVKKKETEEMCNKRSRLLAESDLVATKFRRMEEKWD
jgi:hypothetical protein